MRKKPDRKVPELPLTVIRIPFALVIVTVALWAAGILDSLKCLQTYRNNCFWQQVRE
jgi:hypothetical protein